MRSEKGFSLLETMIGLVIMGLIGVMILSALAMASKSNIVNSEQTKSESLARSQLEYILNQPYNSIDNPPVYSMVSIPADCSGLTFATPMAARIDANGNVVSSDTGLQRITVTVNRGSDTRYTIVGYKVNK